MMTRRPAPWSAATQARMATGWAALLLFTNTPRGPASKMTASLIAHPPTAARQTAAVLQHSADWRSVPQSGHSLLEAVGPSPSRRKTPLATWWPSLGDGTLLPPGLVVEAVAVAAAGTPTIAPAPP